MDRELALKLVLQLQDALTTPGAKALGTFQQQSIKTTEAINAAATKSTASAAEAQARLAIAGIQRQSREMQRMYQDRERLGIRSEQRIQREIAVTEAAYTRLRESGVLSWTEQARAAARLREQVTALNNEMGRMTGRQALRGAFGLAGGAIAGISAARMVAQPKVEAAMEYDLRLAHMANTAFAGQSLAARRAGMSGLDASIIQALRFGGGTRDTAAEALDAMIASGAIPVNAAQSMLPALMRTSTAANAPATQLASIGIRGMQTFKLQPGQIQTILDMALAGGQAGGFELKDMAKWLPQQMAAATMSGMTGLSGFAKLVAANQASVITAGTKDEAGNNLVNLLAKINSQDTANDAKKLGINLPKYLAQQRLKGVDSLDAFVGLVDKTVQANPGWQTIQKRLANAKDDSEKREAYESMATIVQGASVGKLIQDRQALMALVAIMNNRAYMTDVQAKVLNSAGASDANFDLISQTGSFKFGQAGNERQFAEQRIFDAVSGPLGKIAEGMTANARQYPELTTAMVALTTASTAAAAAMAGFGGFSLLAGGAGAGRLAGMAGMAGNAGLVGLAGLGGLGVGTLIDWGGGKALSSMTGKKDESIGGYLHDLFNGDAFKKFQEAKSQKLEITLTYDATGKPVINYGQPGGPRLPIRPDAGPVMLNLN